MKRLRVLPVVVFTATTFVFLAPALLGQRTYAGVDLLESGAPYRDALGRPPHIESPIQTDQAEGLARAVDFYDSLRDAKWPLWNDDVAAGFPDGILPLNGIQSPFGIGFLFLPAWYAVGVKVALTLLFCQWATYLFLRRLGVSELVATLGGVAYAYCGTNLVLIHRVGAVVLLPALLWAADRLVEKRSWGRVCALAVAVAWTWFEGFPVAFVYCMYVTAAWCVWATLRRQDAARPTRQRLRAAFRDLLPVGGAFTAGGLLSAISVVPLLAEVVSRHAVQTRVATLLAPVQQFGALEPRALGGYPTGPFWTGLNPVESGSYVGLVVVAGAAIAYVAVARGRVAFSRPAATAWAFFAVVGPAIFLVCYRHIPLLSNVITNLPGIANNPVGRMRFISNFAVVVVAALWLSRSTRDSLKPSRAVAAVGIVAVSLSFALAVPRLISGARDANDVRELLASLAVNAVVGSAVAVAVVMVRRTSGRAVTIAGGVAAMLLFVHLARPYWAFTPASPVGDFYTTQAGHRALRHVTAGRYRFASTGIDNFYAGSASLFGLTDLRGLALYRPELKELIRTVNPKAFDRDPLKIILSRDEWNLAAPGLDHLAVGAFALGTGEPPLGHVAAQYAHPWRWVDGGEIESVPHRAPGPLVGIDFPLEALHDCEHSAVEVELRSAGRVLDRSSRPAFDARGQNVSFALVGTSLRKGDLFSVSVRTTDGRCAMRIGASASAGDRQLAFRALAPDADAGLELVATEQAQIYRRPTAWPLVSVHSRWRSFPTQAQALEFVRTVKDDDRDIVPIVGDGGESDVRSASEVVRVRTGRDRVSFRTRSAAPAVAVVSQNLDDHWRATVDGKRATIISVDGALAGVKLPSGTHDVELKYSPTHFYAGAIITAFTAVGLAAGAVISRRRGRRRADPRDAALSS